MWSLSNWSGRIFKNGIFPEGIDRRALPRPLKVSLRVLDRVAHSGRLPGKPVMSAAGVCLLVVIGGATVSGTQGGNAVLASVTSTFGFAVREIRINGTHEIHREHVRAELKVGEATSIVTYDVHKARERLYELAWVEKVSVAKIYPDTLAVDIVERKPFAVWQKDGELNLIERNGKVIVPFKAKFDDLPVVVGEGAAEQAEGLIELVGRYPSVLQKAKAFVLVSERRWNVFLDNGVTVMLPEKDPAAALARFSRLDQEKQFSKREINVVDLRIKGQMVLRLSEDGVRHRKAKADEKSLVRGQI